MIFLRKIVIFNTKYPNNFRASLRDWKKYDFLAYNRDFSHEIPKKISRLPPLGAIFLSAPLYSSTKDYRKLTIKPRESHNKLSTPKGKQFLLH